MVVTESCLTYMEFLKAICEPPGNASLKLYSREIVSLLQVEKLSYIMISLCSKRSFNWYKNYVFR
jgi:hypothetical protein